MSDFVINFDLLGGLSLDEWWKETDRLEEEEKKKGVTLKLTRETQKSRKSQEMKPGWINRRCGQFAVFKPGVPKEIWLLILNQSPKWS